MFDFKLKDVGRPLQDLPVFHRPLDLRSLIDEAREKRRLMSAKDVRWDPSAGERRSLDVQVAPLVEAGERVLGVGIAFVDATVHRTLEEHLDAARSDLETAYEELQSTVEELETTNEELQSTNEELETMNDELRERTDETMRANAFLASVLSGIDQAVVVVDRELRIIAWNKVAAELWGLREDEVDGEHLLNLDIGLPLDSIRDPIRRVLGGEAADTLLLDGHNRRGQQVTYEVRFAPLEGDLEGAVVGAIVLVAAERP